MSHDNRPFAWIEPADLGGQNFRAGRPLSVWFRLAVTGCLVAAVTACGYFDDSDAGGTGAASAGAGSSSAASTGTKSLGDSSTTQLSTRATGVKVASLITNGTQQGSTSSPNTQSSAAAAPTNISSAGATTGTSGSSASQPAAAPSTVSSGAMPGTATINTLDTIVNDMRLRNDFVLRGYEHQSVGWYVGPGYNVMGNIPNTSNTMQDWKNNNPSLVGVPMRAILPLVVLFDGVSNSANNTRVHMRNIRLYIKSKATKQWRSFGMSPGLSGFNTPKSTLFLGSVAEDKRTNADGSVEIKQPNGGALTWHGWWNLGRTPIDPDDVEAVFVTMQARLTVDNPNLPDDRGNAQFGIQIGADYYIDVNTAWPSVNPAVALSRTKRVTNDWQAFSVMTFSDVGIQEPGAGISEAAFRAAPPPLE